MTYERRYSGEYNLCVDRGRIFLPTKWRSLELIVVASDLIPGMTVPFRFLGCIPTTNYEKVVGEKPRKNPISVDNEGRIQLTSSELSKIGISNGSTVKAIGCFGHFQVWNPKEWDEYIKEYLIEEEVIEKLKEISIGH
ncbi:MAG: hypothetical protein AABX59_00875 [Nanoarchaeota archaeon]